VSDSSTLHSRWLLFPAKFALIWFCGFRGEDLNAIFYQNMCNLYNQYKSVERKISQKNPEYMLIYSKPGRESPWVVPFQNCVRQLHPPFKMATVTKNRNFFNCPLLLYNKS
jgi:hypothetical protein